MLLSLDGGDIKRDDKDVLPRQKCLDALAALRHAKWFQVHRLTYTCAHSTHLLTTTCPMEATEDSDCLLLIPESLLSRALYYFLHFNAGVRTYF